MQYEHPSDERARRAGRIAGIFAASAVVILLCSLVFIAFDLRVISHRLGHIEGVLDNMSRGNAPTE